MTGHREHPRVQQQHTQPQNNHLTLTGKVFFSTLFTLITVALNSSGATRDMRPLGNSDSKRLLRPNLKEKSHGLTNTFSPRVSAKIVQSLSLKIIFPTERNKNIFLRARAPR